MKIKLSTRFNWLEEVVNNSERKEDRKIKEKQRKKYESLLDEKRKIEEKSIEELIDQERMKKEKILIFLKRKKL